MPLRRKARSLIRECMPPAVLRMLCREREPGFYDRSFLAGDHWRRHYTESHYYSQWSIIADRISHAQTLSVLDIGCGPGQFASLLRDQGLIQYLGIDFSPARIEQARKVCPEFDFVEANVFETNLLRTHKYDAAVCLEFLEHVERDLKVIRALRVGTRFYASVPDFGGPAHVRYFHSPDEVEKRYADDLDGLRVDVHQGSREQQFFLLEGVTKGLYNTLI